MTAAIADVEHNSCRQSASVQTQHTRRMEEKLGYLEVLKEHLCRSDSVSDRVIGRFCQQDRVFSRIDIEVFKDLPPDGLHVLPVLHDSVIHRIAQSQNSLVFFLQKAMREAIRKLEATLQQEIYLRHSCQ